MNERPGISMTSSLRSGGPSRREFLRLAAVGTGLSALRASSSRSDGEKRTGRIYARAKLRTEAGEVEGLIAITPEPCSWELLADLPDEPFLVAPDGKSLIFTRRHRGDRIPPSLTWKPVGIERVDLPRGGEPRRILDGVELAAWSPDGKSLIVKKWHQDGAKPRAYETWKVDPDGSNATKLAIPETEDVYDWSSDGRLLTTSNRQWNDRTHFLQLYTMKLDGSAERRITTEPNSDLQPRFSPDGTRIAYTHYDRRAEGNKFSVRVIGADGAGNQTVFPKAWGHPCWSPDGKSLVILVGRQQEGPAGEKYVYQLLLIDPDGRNPRPLPLPEILDLTWFDWR